MDRGSLADHAKNIMDTLNMLDLSVIEQAAVVGLSFQAIVTRLCMLNKPHGRAVISFMLSQMIAQAEEMKIEL